MDDRDLSLEQAAGEHAMRTKTFRRDLLAILSLVKARETGDAADEQAVVNLFWEMWRPRLFDGKNPPPLDDDLEDALLEELARLERECRIQSEPDADFLEEHREAAEQYAHVGAASALRRRKRDGFTDDVRQALQEVSRVLHCLDIGGDNRGIVEAHFSIISLFGVKALVDRELARVKSLDGKYQEAFDMAIDSFLSAEEVWDALVWDDMDLYRNFLIEVRGDDQLEGQMRATIRGCLPLYQPQQLVDCFEELKAQDKSDSWQLVARQCARLAQTLDEDLRETSVLDGNQEAIDWYGYWSRARGWAEGHLGPQDLRKFRKAEEEEGSEVRLKGYFFGESWEKIPAKARAHIINVDVTWLSKARGGAIWAVLNDLQVAAEAMCHTFIWEPLLRFPDDQTLRPILQEARDLNARGRDPNLSTYARVCKHQAFRKFAQGQGASQEEQRFLHSDLPNALYALRIRRNPAEHDPVRLFRREEVEPLVRLFLGIGRYGILPRLAEVGPKLSSKP